MKERELSAAEVQEWKRVDAQIASNSPQSQAEAMAREMWSEWHKETQVPVTAYQRELLVERMFTALSKLIAENERQHKSYNDHLSKLWGQMNTAKEQLTATEAKLSEAKQWMNHRWDCHKSVNARRYVFDRVADDKCPCDCGYSEFLSTLTAEKKEEAK